MYGISTIRSLAVVLTLAAAAQTGFQAQAGDLAAGRDKASVCAPCHGVDGLAKQAHVPNIAGNSDIYLIKQLEAFRGGQRQDPQMSFIAQDLSDEEIANLAAWYAAIEVLVTLPDLPASD